MSNLFTDYPDTPWKKDWKIFSGPSDRTPLVTAAVAGTLSGPDRTWTLQLISPDAPCTVRLFANGCSVSARKRPDRNRIDLLATAPGVICGRTSGLGMPSLNSPSAEIHNETFCTWLKTDSSTALLLQQETRFVLVYSEPSKERALLKAEAALDEDFEALVQKETAARQSVIRLFSVNPRHNHPVALAAENLTGRLRGRTGLLHGLWSVAEGFPVETFSLNELYPLVRAWNLIDPAVALELVQTALNLQQSTGGFPAWVDANGTHSAAAPWPLIAQAFELAWQTGRDPALLKKHLPALRKYMQWAVRRFDPHRDFIPAWQNEQELFVPQKFERGKATPELTVLLIAEIEAVLRLCNQSEHPETGQSLTEERDLLIKTLNSIFWDPVSKAFSNAWKDGHYLQEPSFGSFMPLFWNGLDKEKQTALLEAFEETRGFPGQKDPGSWKQEELDSTARLPAIHQFMALEALRNAGGHLMMLFVHRAREGFASWFERESIEAARGETAGASAYALGPVTAALILTVQAEFEREASKAPTLAQQILQWSHRIRITKTDLRILSVFLLAIIIIHLVYALPRSHSMDARIAEAALDYQQGRYTEALRVCRRYPDNALCALLQANLMMMAEQPEQAQKLYRKALLKETESPSALFGLALSLQMSGEFKQAEKRYSDFIDIHETRFPAAAELADEFLQLAREQFKNPPRWRRVYSLPMMNDLGL